MSGNPHCIECTKFRTDAEAAAHLRNLSSRSKITSSIVIAGTVASILEERGINHGTRTCGGYIQYGNSEECFAPESFSPRPTN